jgi:7-carboxy-7-deazaguanine synthase (Cx14CxxC type)
MDGTVGGKYSAKELANQIAALWPEHQGIPYVVCTGGEPLLQLDEELIDAIHEKDFEIGIETNGTITLPRGIDWVCVSPKANTELVVRNGDELKLVVRQENWEPSLFEDMDFKHFYLQPMDGPRLREFTEWAIHYCLMNPQWRLSIQTHKLLGIR